MTSAKGGTLSLGNQLTATVIAAADPGPIGAGVLWIDTTAPPTHLRQRNAADTAWTDLGALGGGGGVAFPLAWPADEGFQPNGNANLALDLVNDVSSPPTAGIQVIGGDTNSGGSASATIQLQGSDISGGMTIQASDGTLPFTTFPLSVFASHMAIQCDPNSFDVQASGGVRFTSLNQFSFGATASPVLLVTPALADTCGVEIVGAVAASAPGPRIQPTGVAADIDLDVGPKGGGFLNLVIATQDTVGAAGTAAALPAKPTHYALVKVSGTEFAIPLYAPS